MAVASKGSVMVVKDLVEVNLGLARAAFLVSPVAPTGEVLRAVLVAVGELALFAAAVEPAAVSNRQHGACILSVCRFSPGKGGTDERLTSRRRRGCHRCCRRIC